MSRELNLLVSASLVACAAPAAFAAHVPTFNEHIAPIVWKHCTTCHRPGEVAPFSLLSFRDVSKRADQIVDVVSRQVMPPWKPLAGHGKFANERRLADTEIAQLKAWLAAGTPEGKASDRREEPKFTEGWYLGEPDLIVKLPEAIQVPAEGRDLHVNVVLPLEIPTGKFLRAVEFRPSNRRVVHHAVLHVDNSGKARARDEAEPGVGFAAVTPPGKLLAGTMAIWVPGWFPTYLPTGLSMPWPKNGDLVVNLHLHPSGKPEEEQSSLGLYLTDQPPQRSLLDCVLIDTKIDIPPGEKTYRTKDSCVLPIDVEALAIFPHMHMIGKAIEVTATLPDGSIVPLLKIDDWDFNWQDMYQYASPVRLPQGTQLTLTAVHDNSADNPHNPKHPPQRVTWGEQTLNEMSIVFMNLLPVNEGDVKQLSTAKDHRVKMSIPSVTLAALAQAPATPQSGMSAPAAKPAAPDLAKVAADALKKADSDGNGKLNLNEIVAAVGKRESPEELAKKLKQFDVDRDEQLDLAETIEALRAQAKK